ncbi:uncharacterized protein LOC122385729 isoform X1 [Amphibalanus amphitrite]|uniref:uncharacterized protein LOC122385729 isoform X1 n=2 Tax=Amphibalanus amphitrite TaxID=1232801 RepID=UPI001C912020|nr:uncharacterized protein LOC122385729 isoform X1 [Amphibalanus amphitrite]
MAETDRSTCKTWLYFISCGSGLFAGIAGCLVFIFSFSNYQAGFLALFSALLATLCLHLLMLDYYSLLGVWYTPAILRRITVFAVVILVAALGLMAWYLTEVVTKHQGFYPIETSNPVRAVMSLMNVKWSVTLLALSVSLRRRLLGGPAAYRSLSEASPLDPEDS